MANPYEINQQIHSGEFNGQKGKWIPVPENEAPAGVSDDPFHPTVSHGNVYYARETTNYCNPAPIGANMNNAIPAPSPVVQLPPIVQPIAMVPYTTQNQPLVQYDPNYRPPVEHTAAPEPVYKPKAYAGISTVIALLAVAVIAVGVLLTVYSGYTVVGAIKALVADGGALSVLTGGDTSVLMEVLVPGLYAIIMVFCVIIMINALVKLGKAKPLGKLNVFTLIALILAIVNIVLMFMKKDMFEIAIGAYVIAGILAVMMILPLFINKKIQVLDYVASKQTYVIK